MRDLRQVLVMIMAQGEQTRLAHLGYPKQLIPIGGEPLLSRTVRQIRSHYMTAENAPIVIAGRPALEPGIGDAALFELAKPGLCVVDGIGAAIDRWHRTCELAARTFVLLGDVAWTDSALDALLVDVRPLVFAGTSDVSASTGEIFGMSLTDPEAVRDLIATCPCRVGRDGAPRSLGNKQRGGHLRRLLWWAMQRQRLRPAKANQTWAPQIYLPIDDATDDIDTPKDLQRLPELVAALRRSDEQSGSQPEERGRERRGTLPTASRPASG